MKFIVKPHVVTSFGDCRGNCGNNCQQCSRLSACFGR